MRSVDQHRQEAQRRVGFAVLTVSDTRTRSEDRSGSLIVDRVGGSGHKVCERRLVRDEIEEIRTALAELLASSEVEAVVVTGGTGLAPRDVTWEALEPLLDRVIPGFGELFRSLSFAEVGAAAMLSRAGAGTVGHKVVFALPGSPGAVDLAMSKLVLPETGHILGQLRD